MAPPRRPKARRRAGVPTRPILHAPWRIEFILAPKPPGCFFCQAAGLPADDSRAWRQSLLLYRNAWGLVIMNRYPYVGGHLLVAPLRHTAGLAALPAEEGDRIWRLSRICVGVLERVLRPQGFNLGMNLGKAGGAGVEDHLHIHVLPRWVGDTNFMPALAGTHSLPVALEALWDQLRPHFEKL